MRSPFLPILPMAVVTTLGCVPDAATPNDVVALPLCVAGFQPNARLSVRLGAIYDASSDYLYDGSLAPFYSTPSCAGEDGMQTGSIVTFVLNGAATGAVGDSCAASRAHLDPDSLMVDDSLAGVIARPGVSIAAAYGNGSLNGRPTSAVRGLFTPNKMPRSTPVSRELPPLVVIRELRWQDPKTEEVEACFDSWIGSWESTP